MGTDGLQVTLSVDAPGGCPVAAASEESDAAVESVTWSASGEAVTEEFTVAGSVDRADATPVFETEERTRYRFERETGGCVCELVERRGRPPTDVRAEDGRLRLSFYAPNVETVREIVADLRDRYGGVRLSHLRRSGDLEDENPVLVDRSRLTDRQREVLETAYERGYFEHPKEANASDLAAELDVSLSTFVEHLSVAQSKVLDDLL